MLTSFRLFCPYKFSRKPRPFSELKHWKATEFRQFILYNGIVIFARCLDPLTKYNFLLLHCAYRLLLNKNGCINNVPIASKMMETFVEKFPKIYGMNNKL